MNLDAHALKIPCPHCAKPLDITIGQAKRNPNIECGSCGAGVKLDADQFKREIAKVEKALADLKRQLGNFGR